MSQQQQRATTTRKEKLITKKFSSSAVEMFYKFVLIALHTSRSAFAYALRLELVGTQSVLSGFWFFCYFFRVFWIISFERHPIWLRWKKMIWICSTASDGVFRLHIPSTKYCNVADLPQKPEASPGNKYADQCGCAVNCGLRLPPSFATIMERTSSVLIDCTRMSALLLANN